ncbi:MAG TPA: PEPxxWA-CTERM sorting domain-containing protein [Rhizomicrobium sp.]|nr:PEPxxWA-CTERM sorting domain-containing protein [Rhizomicrobium sp.]
MNKHLILAVGLLAAAPLPAAAAGFIVDAKANSANISGTTVTGTGLATISLTAGENFGVTSSTNDLWSLGALPRFSDADGLTANRFATAADDSGQAVGTLIGQDFGPLTAGGLTTAFGTLVGEIGGVFEVLGTNFHGPAWATGTLTLYNWDTFTADNTGDIAVDVTAGVPEPATWAMMLLGFLTMGLMARRRIAATA